MGFEKSNTVIIASGEDYGYALLATPLSRIKDGPILLSKKTSLDPSTISEIKRLKASKAILIGSTGVIGSGVDKQLKSIGVGITRISGTDRYDISRKVAELVGVKNGIVIAGNLNYPDILSMANIASIKAMPILFSPQKALHPSIATFLKGKSIPVSYLVGGTNILSAAIEKNTPNSIRLSAINCYSNNLNILNQFAPNLIFDTIYLTSDKAYAEAICGSALAAKNNSPIFIVDKNTIAKSTIDFIKNIKVKHIVIIGGEGILSKAVENELSGAVYKPEIDVESVILNKTTLGLNLGGTDNLIATLAPESATNKAVTWTSSNKGVVTVDNMGRVTAISEGAATITVTTLDKGISANCNVLVTKPIVKVSAVSINKNKVSLVVGGSDTLSVEISPSNATNKAITWKSLNNAIVTVSSTGKINALAPGTTTVSAITNDGSKAAQCTVTVTNPIVKVSSINLNKSVDNLLVGGTDLLSVTISPGTATNKGVVWSSTDKTVATIDNTGKITAQSPGVTTISAISVDGNKVTTCMVTISKPPLIKVESISLDKAIDEIVIDSMDRLSANIYPINATNKYITWASSNNDVATVDIGGNIKAISTGSAIVTATTADGKYTANCEITVTETSGSTIPPAKEPLVFAIDIGHNAKYDSGAVGIRSEDVCTEEVGTLVIQKLTDLGYTVIDCSPTNSTSQTDALKQRVDIANAAKADYYVSIHFNIFNKIANGTEVYMGSNKIKDKAQAVLNNFVNLGYSNRGLKDNSKGLYVLRNTNMPAMLIECSFLDSVEDMARYNPEDISDAIVNGLVGQ